MYVTHYALYAITAMPVHDCCWLCGEMSLPIIRPYCLDYSVSTRNQALDMAQLLLLCFS